MTSLRAFLSRICAHCRPLRGATKEPAGDNISMIFIDRQPVLHDGKVCDDAQCMPVCGNLFHHAVEMLLKGGLAQKGENARWFSEGFCACRRRAGR